jgi:hypothetical protein
LLCDILDAVGPADLGGGGPSATDVCPQYCTSRARHAEQRDTAQQRGVLERQLAVYARWQGELDFEAKRHALEQLDVRMVAIGKDWSLAGSVADDPTVETLTHAAFELLGARNAPAPKAGVVRLTR